VVAAVVEAVVEEMERLLRSHPDSRQVSIAAIR
jgi:hypothetical protein